MNNILTQLINQFMPFAQEHIGFNEPPKLFLKQDEENASNPLGKTAFYNPAEKSVTLYVTGRHPKDVLRSLGHELVHHKQNCDGKFENAGDMGEGYAQKNPHLRQMEIEANSVGSMCLRDFEDGLREQKTIYYEHLQKGEKTMSMKDWKNKELTTLLSEAWGFKFNTLQEFDEFNGTGEIQEEGGEELEELAQARQPRERAKPHGTGARVEPDAPFGKPPTDKDEEEEEESLEESEDTGASEDDDSKTHPGEKDYTTKKGDKLKDTEDDGARGEKKGDEADINESEGKDELRETIKALLGKYIKG
ncbi:MAG TPA: hypothetical protein EYN67_13095 [Flavobacteriales bacterium]|nr:hypothetical protein [Flavobacteriales bacterium]